MDNKKYRFTSLLSGKRTALFLCFTAGVAGTLPYYFEDLFIFTFISLFALFYLTENYRKNHGRIFIPYFLYFTGFFTPLYLFLSELYPFERFGFTQTEAVFVVICSCVLIPLIHSLVQSVILFLSKFSSDGISRSLCIASLWVVGEWCLSLGVLAFPWSNIAVSLTGFLPYLQTASLFGKSFITFITVFACHSAASGILNGKKLFTVLGICAVALNSFAGLILWFIPFEPKSEQDVALIQGNVLSNEKWSYSNRNDIFERYISMTRQAAENGAKIIVLPESAIPISFTENGRIHKSLADITREFGATVIIGINYSDGDAQYNSVISVLPDGSLSERYDKRHLVPFGEFIPFADIIGKLVPFVGELSSDSGEYIQGSEPVIISTPYGGVAPLVCFDSIFPDFSAEGVREGGEIISVLTNDSWFNDSVGIYTHLRHSQLRAIENRRYVIRAANTGISAVINEKGKIIAETEPLCSDILHCGAELFQSYTLYSLTGDVVIYISFIILTIFIFIRRKYANRSVT